MQNENMVAIARDMDFYKVGRLLTNGSNLFDALGETEINIGSRRLMGANWIMRTEDSVIQYARDCIDECDPDSDEGQLATSCLIITRMRDRKETTEIYQPYGEEIDGFIENVGDYWDTTAIGIYAEDQNWIISHERFWKESKFVDIEVPESIIGIINSIPDEILARCTGTPKGIECATSKFKCGAFAEWDGAFCTIKCRAVDKLFIADDYELFHAFTHWGHEPGEEWCKPVKNAKINQYDADDGNILPLSRLDEYLDLSRNEMKLIKERYDNNGRRNRTGPDIPGENMAAHMISVPGYDPVLYMAIGRKGEVTACFVAEKHGSEPKRSQASPQTALREFLEKRYGKIDEDQTMVMFECDM